MGLVDIQSHIYLKKPVLNFHCEDGCVNFRKDTVRQVRDNLGCVI